MANKKMERAQKEKDEGQGKRQVQEWPSELVFFLRTVELLQGICSLTGHQVRLKQGSYEYFCFTATMTASDRTSCFHVDSPVKAVYLAGYCFSVCTMCAFVLAVQLMESMTLMARRALMSRVPIADRMHAPVHASRGAAASNPRSTLEVSLRKMLEDMVKGDALLGIQVCVWKGRSFQVDVAAGRMGQLDPRPVTPKSLFPCFSVSRLATAAVVNSFVNSGITRMYCCCLRHLYNLANCLMYLLLCALDAGFSDTVSSVWQPFSAGGKQGVTVSDFLKCRSGVEGALPAVLSTYSSFSSVELDTIAAQIAERPYQVLGEPRSYLMGNRVKMRTIALLTSNYKEVFGCVCKVLVYCS